jgi:hypothetical protein
MDTLTRSVSWSLEESDADADAPLLWSRWFRCESSFSLMLVPNQPGLFAIAEELAAPGDFLASGGKRMLAIQEVGEAEDMGSTLGLWLGAKGRFHDRMGERNCFVRFAVVTNHAQRQQAANTLRKWVASSAEAASGLAHDFATQNESISSHASPTAGTRVTAGTQPQGVHTEIGPLSTLPSGF